MRHVLVAIDRLHMDGALPTIPVVREPIPDAEAQYQAAPSMRIVVGTQAGEPSFSFVHEIGHFIDHQGIGEPGRWGSMRSPELGPWRRAIRASTSYQRLKRIRRWAGGGPLAQEVRYLMRPIELWARSYTQYVATRSGDPTLLTTLAARRTTTSGGVSPDYWSDADFARIAAAIDDLFKAKGWMP